MRKIDKIQNWLSAEGIGNGDDFFYELRELDCNPSSSVFLRGKRKHEGEGWRCRNS